MSATLRDAARSPMEMVDIPSANYPPTTEEDMQKVEEIARELAEQAARSLTEKTGEAICKDEHEEEEEKKQRQHRTRTHGGR